MKVCVLWSFIQGSITIKFEDKEYGWALDNVTDAERKWVHVQFSSFQYGIYAIGKAHITFHPVSQKFPKFRNRCTGTPDCSSSCSKHLKHQQEAQ